MINNNIIIFNPSIEDGGVEKNLFIISNYLSKKLKNLSLITSDYKKKEFSKNIKIITHRFKLNKNAGRKLKYLLCLILLIREILLNKRNCLVLSFQANIYAIIICYLFNVKIISRSNSSPSGWSKNPIKNIIFKYFLKKADLIIVNSKDFKKEIDFKFNLNSKLIYNPFNFNLIKKKSNEKLKLSFFSKKTLNIITVGRLTEQKDQITLIKAINIASKLINVRAIIIGKGNLKERLNNLILNYNLKKNIKLIGYKKNPYKYIKKADIFLLTSIFEGHPNVLIEAQYLKKFIISSNCPTGPKEILNNGKLGNLFPIKDHVKLSNLLVKYKNNKINNLKIKTGYENLSKYDLEKNCNIYLKVILKFLNNT
jgi:glycosyltransferase involved in cell wall biosynthesis